MEDPIRPCPFLHEEPHTPMVDGRQHVTCPLRLARIREQLQHRRPCATWLGRAQHGARVRRVAQRCVGRVRVARFGSREGVPRPVVVLAVAAYARTADRIAHAPERPALLAHQPLRRCGGGHGGRRGAGSGGGRRMARRRSGRIGAHRSGSLDSRSCRCGGGGGSDRLGDSGTLVRRACGGPALHASAHHNALRGTLVRRACGGPALHASAHHSALRGTLVRRFGCSRHGLVHHRRWCQLVT